MFAVFAFIGGTCLLRFCLSRCVIRSILRDLRMRTRTRQVRERKSPDNFHVRYRLNRGYMRK